ncbi:MAG: D-glycero-beta-D-manno-heptose 1,7-bisphosphate 7-phosphatase [Pseudomonadota bacterium]
MARLILLDRDGVINYDSPDYIKTAEEWHPLPGSIAAIARMKAQGLRVAVCTNQAGIGRGIIRPAELERIHRKLHGHVAKAGAALDGLIYCPHVPEAHCECRKPNPGMLLRMMHDLDCDAKETLFVGDSLKDVEAARRAGCTPVLVRTGNGANAETRARALGVTCVADDLAAVAAALADGASCAI